ncbi:MAG: hypothetical protein JNL85_00745 [Rubrivivax sp.]|nr:hypothetical protein [Rubrivivax sp.]
MSAQPARSDRPRRARQAWQAWQERPRRQRIGLGALGGVALLLAVVATCEVLEWPFLRSPLEHALAGALGRPVTLSGPFGVRLLGPVRVHAGEIVVGAAPSGNAANDPGSSRNAAEAGHAAAGREAPVHLLRASDARLVVAPSTLWQLRSRKPGEPLYIESLDVAKIDLHLRRNAQGQTNWAIGPPAAAASERGAARAREAAASELIAEQRSSTAAAAPAWPVFGTLRVREGLIRYVDALLAADVQAKVRTEEGGTVAPPAAAASATAASASPPPAGLRVELEGTWHAQPLAGWLESSGFLPLMRTADDGAAGAPLKADLRAGRARLKLAGHASDVVHLGGFDGEFDLVGPSLAAIGTALGMTLPTTAEFAMQGRIAKEGSVWQAQIPQWSVGTSRLRAAFRYDPRLPVPLLTGTLGGARLALADLGPAIGTKAPDGAAVPPPAGRVLPAREFDIPSLRRMDADVQVDLGRLDLGTEQLESFMPLRGRVLLRDGVLSLHDLVATAAAGTLRGAITLDARPDAKTEQAAAAAASAARAAASGGAALASTTLAARGKAAAPTAAQPRWSADIQWSGIQLERFVRARDPQSKAGGKAEPKAGSKGDTRKEASASATATASAPNTGQAAAQGNASSAYVSGLLGGSAKVVGHGRSIASVLGSLDGTATLTIRGGTLSHLLVEAAGLDLFEGLGVIISGDTQLPMRCALARLVLHDGRARPEVALIDTPDTTLLVAGEVSLPGEQLALQVRALPHDSSPFALRSPIGIGGTFADPVVHLDKKSIARRIARAAALALAAPPAALLALVDLGEDDRDRCHDAVATIERHRGDGGKGGSRTAAAPAPVRR